jgi:hypothetical protein
MTHFYFNCGKQLPKKESSQSTSHDRTSPPESMSKKSNSSYKRRLICSPRTSMSSKTQASGTSFLRLARTLPSRSDYCKLYREKYIYSLGRPSQSLKVDLFEPFESYVFLGSTSLTGVQNPVALGQEVWQKRALLLLLLLLVLRFYGLLLK